MNRPRNLMVITMAAVSGLILLAGSVLAEAEAPAGAEQPAEEAPPTAVEAEVPPEEVIAPEEVVPTVTITPTGLISFDFREAPVRDVLRLFARQVNVNIVATPAVVGTVSMKLDNVRWRKALELILEVNKLKMTEDTENNIIKVLTEAEVAAEPMVTKVYHLSYLSAADYEVETLDYEEGKRVKKTRVMEGAAKKLKPLVAENETMEADAAGNKLIVHATPASHDRVKAALAELDKQTRQVEIKVQFIEASTEAAKNLGIKWDFLREYGAEATDVARVFSKTIGKTDTSRTGFSDESTTEERTLSSWTDSTIGGVSSRDVIDSFSRDIGGLRTATAGWDRARDVASETIKTATLSADKLRLVVSALLEDSGAKLVSHPRIFTVDNKQATIRAVKEWPIPRYSYNGETGTWEINGFDFKDIGITLRVTPHINADNFITLDVDPEVSAVVGEKTFEEVSLPLVDTRNAATRVIVKSGEALVIGGLVKTDEILKKSGLPLLKDIPLLGNLFRHTSKTSIDLDLMILITPTIVEGPAAAVVAPPTE